MENTIILGSSDGRLMKLVPQMYLTMTHITENTSAKYYDTNILGINHQEIEVEFGPQAGGKVN
jgi:hypothetical protein